MSESYCLAENESIVLSGLTTDETFERVEIQVYLCTTCTVSNGINVSDVIQQYVRDKMFYTMKFLVANTGFNPTERVSNFKYINSDAWITFTDRIGTEYQMTFGTYKVKTDENVLPW